MRTGTAIRLLLMLECTINSPLVLRSTQRLEDAGAPLPMEGAARDDSIYGILNALQKRKSSTGSVAYKEVAILPGRNASLVCAFVTAADRTVSWFLRQGDAVRLLTVGKQNYNREKNISVNASPDEQVWTLNIQTVGKDDEGFYECQSSEQPTTMQRVFLKVFVPEMKMVDEKGQGLTEKHYRSGSTIEMTCLVRRVPPGSRVFWKQNGRVLNDDHRRGGISIRTDVRGDEIRSLLHLANARSSDSGQYVCSLSGNLESRAVVYILDDESPAAMQQESLGAYGAVKSKMVLHATLMTGLVARRLLQL